MAVGDLTDLQNRAKLESYRLKVHTYIPMYVYIAKLYILSFYEIIQIAIIIDMLDLLYLLYPFFTNKKPDEIEKAKSSGKYNVKI